MIGLNKRLNELTWGEIISDLDERYGKQAMLKVIPANPASGDFMNVKECAILTGYKPDYIRQLVFKKAIPYHKNPKLKPVRFKREEILAWMTSKKFTPISRLKTIFLKDQF